MRDWGRTHNDKRSVRRVDRFRVEIGSVKIRIGRQKSEVSSLGDLVENLKKIAQVVLGKTEITQKHDFTQ